MNQYLMVNNLQSEENKWVYPDDVDNIESYYIPRV